MITIVSECFIKPKYYTEEAKEPIYMSQGDLMSLPISYMQKGFLFSKQENNGKAIETFLERLKDSLSVALVHFYPLAGQLEIQVNQDEHSSFIFINPIKGPGAKFIFASVDLTASDILSPTDVPKVVNSFFDHHSVPVSSYDGYMTSLLAVKVTELVDSIFIGCSINHACADGMSYMHFLSSWSEIIQSRGNSISISRPPIHKRWFIDGTGPLIKLPFTSRDEFVSSYKTPPLRERIFRFSAASIARIKAAANSEFESNKVVISSYQALSALVWRSITKARKSNSQSPQDTDTTCLLTADTRRRLDPPLSENYFGCSTSGATVTCKASELLEFSLSWSALRLNRAVASLNDELLRSIIKRWFKHPWLSKIDGLLHSPLVMMTSSPKFDMYGIEFGMGKAVAVRNGLTVKYDGRVASRRGRDEEGSIELEICLLPDNMSAIESDEEFMMWVS